MGLAADFRFGFRALRKSPGFALTAVVIMALGVGATTAIFSVTDALLWKPVPLPDLNTMVMVVGVYPDDPRAWTSTTLLNFLPAVGNRGKRDCGEQQSD